MASASADMRRVSSSSSRSSLGASEPPPAPVPTNVRVAVRCRPLNAREKAANRAAVVQCKPNSNEVSVVRRRSYRFDKVFGQYSTQKDVFRAMVQPAVDEALAGYNCTVFAYGQTGTGKTYTMQGELAPGHETAGIIPRSVRYIFDALEASQQEFSVKVSFLQLYNEELKDLLEPSEDKKLRLMEDAKRGGVYCQNLLEVATTTAQHVNQLVDTGVQNRFTSETLMNEFSSRSHSIFTIRIHRKEHNPAGEDLLKVGQLNLVDLAGSECIGRSGARNARAREAGSINQSLLTLGRVITALVDNHPHVPYRDSKLTRLLQESLGGKAKTTIIATLAPCADSVDETMSTLEYAFRAKNIKNKPEVNQTMTKSVLLSEFGSEIESLRAALRAARSKDGVFLPPEQFAEMQERLAGQGVQLLELEDELKVRNTRCKELEETVERHASAMNEMITAKKQVSDKLEETERELASTQDTLQRTMHELKITQQKLGAFQANEQVLLANGARAAKLYKDSEKRAAQLLSKIELKQQLEDANTELATSYRGQSQSQINVFQQSLEQHKERQEEMFRGVSSAMQELQSVHSTDLEALTTSLNALQGLIEGQKAQTSEDHTHDESLKREQRKQVGKSMSEQQQAMLKQLEKFVQMSNDHASVLENELSTSKEQSSAFLKQVQTMVEDSRVEMGTFLSEQSDKLLELQVTIDMSIEEQTKQLKDNKAVLLAALKDSHAQQQQKLSSMKTQLAEYVDQCIQSQSEKLDEQASLIEENANGQHKQLTQMRSTTEQEMKSFVQSMGDQNSKHEGKTAALREEISNMHGQVEENSLKQNELIRSQVSAQTIWSGDASVLQKEHTSRVSNLVEQHQQADAKASAKKQAQLATFFGEHEELRELLNGGCKTLEDGLQSRISTTKDSIQSASKLAGETIANATEESSHRLQELETYMKKRRIDVRTGETPMKKDDRVFPAFEPTKVADQSPEAGNVASVDVSYTTSSETTAGHKRRRLSDEFKSTSASSSSAEALPLGNNPVKNLTEDSADAPIDASEEAAPASISSQESTHSFKSTSEIAAPSTSAATSRVHKQHVVPSKTKKATVSGVSMKKKLGHRGMKVSSTEASSTARTTSAAGARAAHPSATRTAHIPGARATHTTQPRATHTTGTGGARKTSKLSALAAPKKHRPKSPLGEATNLR